MISARPGQVTRANLPEPEVVRRRVSSRGAVMIGGQRIQVGFPHADKTAEVTVQAYTYLVTVEDGIAITAARMSSRDIRRHLASHYPISLPVRQLQGQAGDEMNQPRPEALA